MPFSSDKVTIQLDRATRDELNIVKGVYGLYSYNDAILYLLHLNAEMRADMLAVGKGDPRKGGRQR